MQSPYTAHPYDAFMIAEASTAVVLSAIVLFRPLRSAVASLVFLAAIWTAATAPEALAFYASFHATPVSPTSVFTLLRISAGLATAAMFVTRPRWLGAIALVGEVALWKATSSIPDSTLELCALHLAWLGALLGLHQLVSNPPVDESPRSPFEPNRYLRQDLLLGAAATLLSALVSVFVILRACDSADEWGYTYQASVFAKLHAYGTAPSCFSAFQNYWIFSSQGRMFAMYTPGWPLFMAPFAAIGAVWLAGPFSLGLLVVGLARVARRTVAGTFPGREDVAAAGGVIAAVTVMLSSTVLINGGSRFSHIFVCACFAWAIESLAEMTSASATTTPRRAVGWGVVLGLSTSWLLATRPADGAMLGIGLFVYFVWALVRRRVAWVAVGATAVAFVLWGGLSLVLLRLQLGKWFTTGYSLIVDFQPWAVFSMSTPKASELRYSISLYTGAYCWWPLAPAVGLAGLVATLRGRGRSIAFILVVGSVALLTFYTFVAFGRGWDFGYGPRYQLPLIVPMAVGTAVVIAPMWAAARARRHSLRAIRAGGPVLLAIAAALIGAARLAPLVYPPVHDDILARKHVNEEAYKEKLKNAIVWIRPGTTMADVRDLTENLPFDLYPDPDVIFAIDNGEESRQCVRQKFPGRAQYHQRPGSELLVKE